MLHLYSVTPLEGRVFGVRDTFCFDTRGGESTPSEHTGACRLAFRRIDERGPPVRAQCERSDGSTGRLSICMVSVVKYIRLRMLSDVPFPCIRPHLHERLLGSCTFCRLFVEATVYMMN
jgi:hypothetical protein